MAEITLKHGPIRDVIHVGGHHGQEIPSYLAAGAIRIDVFEPIPDNIEIMARQWAADTRVVLHHTALGDYTGEATLHIASNEGQSSSVLVPLDHLTQYPGISFQTSKTVPMRRLDDFNLPGADFLAADVQGYELEVFRGAARTLEKVRMVYCEVNRAELYRGCAMVEEIDAFLRPYGFSRVATEWLGHTWGDALYTKT